jgi:Uma2 family endonuclease
MLEVDPSLLEQRRRLGLDRWDEMWEGVLHMSPAPGNEHQRIVSELLFFLMGLLRRQQRGTVRVQINVFDESSATDNYRIPDLTFVAAGHESLLVEDGVRGGGPDAAIEIRSPGDESYDKLPFFAKVGAREVIIIDRDTKRAQVFSLAAGVYVEQNADADGAVTSETLGVRWLTVGGRLVVSDIGEPADRIEI